MKMQQHLLHGIVAAVYMIHGSKRPMTGISHPTDFTPVSIADPTSKSIAKESSSLRSSSRELHESKCWKKRRLGQRRDKAI
ncbi:hypothetical protein Goklo_019963 [Gossypium klotzschianum]|uniref:Uncharacterized protein n=1 Tax=Gossypium klotzschianum TaxID=34286 RepID=A0A7J8UQI8_9ROSI|nr:hypothetical protein [Gossypium klotzschianum]